MANHTPATLSDHDLLIETQRAAATERRATASLLALLAEVDTRRLYLGEGFSSLFQYATRCLRLSDPAAYSRITAARAARRFPAVLALVDDGALSLSTVGLLAPHLTDDNHAALLDAARHTSKRDVERLVAGLHPQPDIPSSVRALPARPVPRTVTPVAEAPAVERPPAEVASAPTPTSTTLPDSAPSAIATEAAPHRPALVAPLSARRYLVRMTITDETQEKLRRAQDLLRSVIPDGDPAAIFDRALTVLLAQTERAKIGAAERPARRSTARSHGATDSPSRHVPSAVRRAVWARDQARCAFVGSNRRCEATGGLEFHHVVPFAAGGPTTVDNIQLRCRAHNAYEGALAFGDWRNKPRARRNGSVNSSVRTELPLAGGGDVAVFDGLAQRGGAGVGRGS